MTSYNQDNARATATGWWMAPGPALCPCCEQLHHIEAMLHCSVCDGIVCAVCVVVSVDSDPRCYDRPYYLGPDGNSAAYFAFAEAIEDSALEGFARWVMRGKAHVGALRLHLGYPVLMSLRYADEIVAGASLEAPGGPAMNPKELDMARQLIGMLAAELDLSSFHDAYRDRVLKMVEEKATGARRLRPVRVSTKKPSEDLGRALQASLKAVRKTA